VKQKLGMLKNAQNVKGDKYTMPQLSMGIFKLYISVEKSHKVRFFFFYKPFTTNKLRLSLYTHTASGNPRSPMGFLAQFVRSEHFSYSQSKTEQ